MRRLRITIIVLAVWFIILFNVERPDIGDQQIIDLAPTVYAVAALISGSMFILPGLDRLPTWLLYGSTLVYIPLKAILGYSLVGPALIPTVFEVLALMITVVISKTIASDLHEVEQAVEDVVLEADNTRIVSSTEGLERINEELQRARRYDRPVSLVYCEIDPATVEANILKTVEEIGMTLKHRYVQVGVSRTIDAALHNIDIISAMDSENGFVVCLPETAGSAARAIGERLQTLVDERHNLRLNIGVSTFGQDALTYEELLGQAQSDYWNRLLLTDPDHPGEEETKLQQPGRFYDTRHDEMAWVNALPRQSASARTVYAVFKRVFDLSVSLAVMPFVLPLLLLISLLIVIDNGRPVFFMQDRTGMGGKRFKMFKFRTMVPNAEELLKQMTETNVKGELAGPIKLKNDPRITRVGRILRKTSLDEIPQILNVLRGEMSLVGPRPTSWSLTSYQLWQTERLNVRPGITGLWQVSDRGDTNFDEWLRWDVKYIERMSFWLDMRILVRTFTSVLQRKGAR